MKPEIRGQIFIQGNEKSGRLFSGKRDVIADVKEEKALQLSVQAQ
jgi:hypothetical protein